jgi:cell division initiation protein
MKMTPLDIRQKRFETAFRGYAPKEVEGFLELTAGEFEEVVRENISLKEELKRTQSRLEQHLERERALQETMVTAQRISEDLKAQAKKEAEVLLAEAEVQADKIVAGANNRMVELVKDLNELKRQKVQFEAQLESVIESHRKLLETFKTPVGADVAFLLKKNTENAG